jgi:hypothetical protein
MEEGKNPRFLRSFAKRSEDITVQHNSVWMRI